MVRSIVHPETFLPRLLDRVALFQWGVEPPPIFIELVHQMIAITRDRHFSLTTLKHFCKLNVLTFLHLETVSAAIATRIVEIRRIAIDQSSLAIIELDYFGSRAILYLNPQQSLRNVR